MDVDTLQLKISVGAFSVLTAAHISAVHGCVKPG